MQRLKSVTWLRNHGLRIVYRTSGGLESRFEGPDGTLSMREAALALRTHRTAMYRLKLAGGIETATDAFGGLERVSMREVLRLRREKWRPRAYRRTAATAS